MSEDATTKPTLETVLERIAELRDIVLDFRRNVETRFETIENRLVTIEADVATIKDEQKRQAQQMDRLTKHMYEIGVDLYDLRHEFHKANPVAPQ